jgi:hypothetical protein
MEKMQAIETEIRVAKAMDRWVNVFKRHSQQPSQHLSNVHWVEVTGVWIKSSGALNHRGVYWNGLGIQTDTKSLQNEIVQVNPPVSGSPPGNCQGVVAQDSSGSVWILHRGRMNVAQQRVLLSDYSMDAARLSVVPVLVSYKDGLELECFPVAKLGDPDLAVLAATRRFVEFCRIARTVALEGEEAAEIQRKTSGFEEPSGTYTIPAREEIVAERIHAEVFAALKKELKDRDIPHTNEKISLLGPDLYTTDKVEPMLFEIKTGNAADDVLKAVGQLVVYEQLLKDARRKVVVLPSDVRSDYKELLGRLDIEIVCYDRAKKGEISFAWPARFFELRPPQASTSKIREAGFR